MMWILRDIAHLIAFAARGGRCSCMRTQEQLQIVRQQMRAFGLPDA